MRCLLALAALTLAAPAVSQPVVVPRAPTVDAALRADLGLAAPVPPASDWEAPPVLYWTGVLVDIGVLAGGAYVLVQGARLLAAADDGPWAGQLPAVLFGSMGIVIGVTTIGFATYDLVRVATGDDPALARIFDPTRLPPGAPPRPPY